MLPCRIMVSSMQRSTGCVSSEPGTSRRAGLAVAFIKTAQSAFAQEQCFGSWSWECNKICRKIFIKPTNYVFVVV